MEFKAQVEGWPSTGYRNISFILPGGKAECIFCYRRVYGCCGEVRAWQWVASTLCRSVCVGFAFSAFPLPFPNLSFFFQVLKNWFCTTSVSTQSHFLLYVHVLLWVSASKGEGSSE